MNRNGAERSGLFCVALYVAQQIMTQQKVDIFSAVKHVRLYRPQCISNEVCVFFTLFYTCFSAICKGLDYSETTKCFLFYFRNSIFSSMSLHGSSSNEEINKPRSFNFHHHQFLMAVVKMFILQTYFNTIMNLDGLIL